MSDLRKIDALVAEHVYGWKRNPNPDAFGGAWITEDGYEAVFAGNYSTDIALAIGVLEKLMESGQILNWELLREDEWLFTEVEPFEEPISKRSWSRQTPLPEAICRHVLHVLGIEVPK